MIHNGCAFNVQLMINVKMSLLLIKGKKTKEAK